MFQPPSSGFEIQVPEPLHVFKNRVTHPDNEQLILAARDSRLLSKAKIKQYKRRRAALEIALARLGWEQLQADLEAVKTSYHEYRVEFHNLKLSLNDTSDVDEQRRIKNEMRQLRQDKALVVENYRRYAALIGQPRQPKHRRIGFFARRSPIKRLAHDLMNGDTPLLKMVRQIRYIDQRLEEHREAVAHEKERDRLCKELAKEAKLFARIIKERWAAMGYCYKFQVNKGNRIKTVTRYVKFARVEVTEDQIHFKVEVTKQGLWGETHNQVPWGVQVGKLIAAEVLMELTTACQRQVTSPHHEEGVDFTNGCWITVNRLGSTDGLMDYIELRQCMATYKRDWHEELPIPMGVKRGRVVNWVRLTKQPHLLVAGQTGVGKSNVFNVFITTLVKMHSPDEIRLLLVDLKEGIGFNLYSGLPHLLTGIVTEVEQLDVVLQQLEMLRRQRTLQIKGIADNIDDYNRRVAPEHKMMRIVVVMDEYQEVSAADKETRERVHTLTHKLVAKARAVGIHLFIGTQVAYMDMLPSKIKANITFVLSGRLRTIGASISTFGSKEAATLPAVKGRMLCDDGNGVYPVQIPYCTGSDITEALETAQTWDTPRPLDLPYIDTTVEAPDIIDVRKLTTEDVIRFAIEQCDGALKAKTIHEQLGKDYGVGQPAITKMVKEIIGSETVSFHGQTYIPTIQRGNWYKLERAEETIEAA
jgi:hypothetical protein